MQFLNNTLTSDKATLRFRRVGEQEWQVRPNINNIKRYVESVDDLPDFNGFHLGSDFGRAIASGDEAPPEYTSWQRLDDTTGLWRGLTLNDLA